MTEVTHKCNFCKAVLTDRLIVKRSILCKRGITIDDEDLDFCGTGCMKAYIDNKLNRDNRAEEFDMNAHAEKCRPMMEGE